MHLSGEHSPSMYNMALSSGLRTTNINKSSWNCELISKHPVELDTVSYGWTVWYCREAKKGGQKELSGKLTEGSPMKDRMVMRHRHGVVRRDVLVRDIGACNYQRIINRTSHCLLC